MAHPLLAAGVSRWWKLHRSLPGGGSKLQGLPTHDADDDQHDGGNDESGDGGDSMVEITLVITSVQVQGMSTHIHDDDVGDADKRDDK